MQLVQYGQMTICTGDQHKKYSLMQYFVGFIFLYKFYRIYCLLYTQSTSQLGQTSCVCHSLVLLRNKMGTMMYVKGKFIRLAHIIWSRYSTMALSCTWEELRTQWLLSSWGCVSQQPPVCYTEGLQHPERVTGLQVTSETWSWVLISE